MCDISLIMIVLSEAFIYLPYCIWEVGDRDYSKRFPMRLTQCLLVFHYLRSFLGRNHRILLSCHGLNSATKLGVSS